MLAARPRIPPSVVDRARTDVVFLHRGRPAVRSFVIASRDEQRILPSTGDTRIDLGVLRPGQLDYSCVMGMYTGTITIV